MLKFFFWILLLANAVLFAYREGYLDTLVPSGREPARMNRQLNADRIRLVPMPEPAASVAPAAPAATEEQPASGSGSNAGANAAAAQAVAVNDAASKKNAALACAEIGNFSADEAKRFSAQAAALALGERLSRRNVQDAVSHIVYIPSLGDRESAEKKAEELRRLGVRDYFVIQDNSNLRWGISLGVFRTEEAARGQLAALNQKGVRSARIGQRSVASNLVAFQLRGLDDAAKSALEKMRAAFPKQEWRNCDGT
jgi:hypothetical protein